MDVVVKAMPNRIGAVLESMEVVPVQHLVLLLAVASLTLLQSSQEAATCHLLA